MRGKRKGCPYCIFANYVYDSEWCSYNFWKKVEKKTKKLRKWKSWKWKVKVPFYAFNSDLHPSFKVKLPQHSKKVEKNEKVGTNENIEKKGKGDHIIYLRVSFMVQSNIPPTFEKSWEKISKRKIKGLIPVANCVHRSK